jgi:phosphoribosylformylglycinamidine cyclo-ligase
MNYKDSGVDIEAGNAFVERLKEKAPGIGGFGGLFKVPDGYEKPILVSGTDGVGTKINICHVSRDYTTIGIDLVAMCVNDVITCGAKPLYFLDYVSCKKIDDRIADLMVGILKGCEIAGVELIGGETAEHGRFAQDIDLAGFCTGIVEESEIIDGSLIKEGDVIIGIESSGLHSNGYSLINDMLWRHKIFYRKGYDDAIDPSPTPELLTPTTIYAPLVEDLLDEFPILGMSHITGGGIVGNLPRCIPYGLEAIVDYNSWNMPKIFSKVMLAGEIPEEEMKRVFNLGIGYCLVVPQEVETDIHLRIYGHGLKSWTIGNIKKCIT